MYNIIKTDVILKILVALSIFSFIGCQKQTDEPTIQKDYATFMLDVDKLTLESANIRVRHNGPSDMVWVYMHTEDMESDASLLIREKVADQLELTEEILAERGQNKSLKVVNLQPKCHYRFICSAIDEITGVPCGEVAELKFRTRRDPSLFERNDNWKISLGDRFVNNDDQMEYDNFICESDDEQTYVFLTLKDTDFDYYYNRDLRALFEDYQSSFGFEEGSSKWKTVLSSGDITCSEQRLRSGDWIAYMVGIDTDGELSGMYQALEFNVKAETPTEEYKRWIGTWAVSDSDGFLFNIEIIPSENNMWYYLSGWESTNIFGFDTNDPALMPELFFDKATGKMFFVSQYLNTLTSGTDAIDFYFTGTFIYGNTYVLGDEVLNLRMAETIFVASDYTEAMIKSLDFVTSGMSFPIESICYMYYAGSQPSAISLAPPTIPLSMHKVE